MGDLGLPVWADMVVQRGRGWTPNLGRFGHPTWTSVGIHYGRSWASTWVGVDVQYGQKWTSSVDEDGRPIWTELGFKDGQKWIPNMDRMRMSKPVHYRAPVPVHYRMPTITPPLWVPIVGLPFCGGMWSSIIGHPPTPNNWASRCVHRGSNSWAPFLDACGPTRTGRPRHLPTRRPIGHAQACC